MRMLLQGSASLEYARAATALAAALQAGGGGSQLDKALQLLQRSLNIRVVRSNPMGSRAHRLIPVPLDRLPSLNGREGAAPQFG